MQHEIKYETLVSELMSVWVKAKESNTPDEKERNKAMAVTKTRLILEGIKNNTIQVRKFQT